jgi:hypothetical protein
VKNILRFGLLRTIAVVVVLAGAVGSLALTLYTGRNNKSFLLIVLFFIWILSPFLALLVANVFAKRWSDLFRMILYSLMIILPLGSLVAYSGVLSPIGAKPAGVFLIVPLVSWLLIVIVILLAAIMARRLSGRSDTL